ncbi:MAG: lysine biosynthesis protein LysW [Chloroflexota bacterium]|nr:MAG: lysine biosynthesis protein LysW [Chloroflexota bacterium]
MTATCPECKHLINLISLPEIGKLFICESCDTKLEVTWLFPVILDYQEYEKQLASDEDENLK